MIHPKSINFTELVKNSNTTLSLGLQTKIVDKLNKTFTEQEQHWYVANLYMYMNYHPTEDYPINLEDVFKMIGFANKGNAKRTLENNFTKDEDYKSSFLPTEKREIGGSLNEQIMLNIDTFKNLCMIAKTELGKEIRRYYVKLENIYNEIIKEEIEEQKILLENKNKELEKTKKQLETKTKLAVKKWYDQEPGHTIYGYKNKNENNYNYELISIGKSKNIKNRENGYMTHNPNGEMFYIRRCYNCDLAEKVLHHIFDKYREESNKEWFTLSENLTIYAIDTVCDFLDSFIICSERLPEFKIKEFINKLPINKFDHTIKLEKEIPFSQRTDLNIVYNPNIKDYKKFIRDICIVDTIDNDKSNFTLTFDLRSAYRLWCKKSLTTDNNNNFTSYINSNFTVKEKYFENDGMRHKIVTNLKLKPLELIVNDKYNVKTYEKFCIDYCIVDYTYNLKFNDFIIHYTKWMQEKYPEYDISSKEISEIKDYFNVKLMFDNGTIYGIQFKSHELPKYTLRNHNKIYMLNENRDVIETFNGLSEASNKLKLEIKTVSDIIRYSKIINNNNQKVMLIYDKGDNLIKTRNVEKKIIYKYNFDTKQLLQKFNSTTEAAHHFDISNHTILRYISIQKIFSYKNEKNIILSYLDNIDNLVIKEPTKVIKSRPCKKLFTYYNNTNELFMEYNGPFDAAAKLKIGQCTVHRHIKNKKPLNIIHNVKKIQIIFTYSKNEI